MKKTSLHILHTLFASLLVMLCIVPFLLIFVRSFWQPGSGISFQSYYDVFLGTSQYLIRFWRSLGICFCIVAGQVAVSVLAGFGFAKYEFAGKQAMFFFLMILMVLPLQVTLIPNYIILDRLDLLGTDKALIFPMIFVPLGTFIMTQSFKAVSNEVIDAAKLDGCSLIQVIIRVAAPIVKGSIVCVGLLSFLDAWNMVEQPIAYLKDFQKYPLSVALAYASAETLTQQLTGCILVFLPPLFFFSCFNKELVEGIVPGEAK